MTAPITELPVRFCHGCSKWDDHPRATVVTDRHNPALDRIYHYDCVPADVAAQHPLVAPALAATSSGLRGQDVRDLMTTHAASIAEAPADVAELEAARGRLDAEIARHTAPQED